ncbi:MAG: ATPase [Rhodoferax ferrireducens]|uniref:ATPase n=2 Tax=Pseudomonadota TaxID=1224 RepID=A0A1Y1QZZ0_9GAMM|nr:MAG: ATPase [Rhodoferax ferrireducens]OQX17471.1 MAG: ATPase [Thiothrix lacustris]
MINRQFETTVRQKLQHIPAVVLLGPRQVGKTTLARILAKDWPSGAVYLDLERPADRLKLEDADSYLRAQQGKLVILDEIHRAPGVFEVLRGIIDDNRQAGQRAGQFLLLGSAALDLMRQSSETLAGRAAYVDMAPINTAEAASAGIPPNTLWLRGGFPDSLLAADDTQSLDWRRDFIRSYLERDVPMFAPRLPAETIGRLWTMLAQNQGSVLNQARIASALGVANPTIDRYIDLLVDLQLVRRLQPWSGNLGKRLVKSPKVYVRDSGLLHGLLALETLDDLLGHPVCGLSFEGFCIDNLIQAAGSQRVPHFYRTQVGAEIDLVLGRGGQPEMAIEIKRSMTPSPEKGFAIACDDLQITQRYVVYPGTESFPLRHGAQAIGLGELMALLSQ